MRVNNEELSIADGFAHSNSPLSPPKEEEEEEQKEIQDVTTFHVKHGTTLFLAYRFSAAAVAARQSRGDDVL